MRAAATILSGFRPIRVDRCVCCATSFARLKHQADAAGAATVDELQEHSTFGTECGTCLPYVRRMLRTGQTVFGEIICEQDEPA